MKTNDFLRWLMVVAFVSFSIVKCQSETKTDIYLKDGTLTLNCSSAPAETVEFFQCDGTKLKNVVDDVKVNILKIKIDSYDKLNHDFSCQDQNGTVYREFNKHPRFEHDTESKDVYNILSNDFLQVIDLKTAKAACKWERKINESSWQLLPVNSTKYEMVDSRLYIKLPEPNDSGVYRCTLENEVGQIEKIIELKVKNQFWMLLPMVIIFTQVCIFSICIITFERRQLRKKHRNEYSFEQSQLKHNPTA